MRWGIIATDRFASALQGFNCWHIFFNKDVNHLLLKPFFYAEKYNNNRTEKKHRRFHEK
jgi:hypothetical protein